MTATQGTAPAPFQVEIPDGWRGVEHPRPGVDLELVADEQVGFEARLTFEAFAELPAGDGDVAPIVRLIGDRVDTLRATMTDALFLDMVRYAPASGAAGLTATVAYRHGPHLVTALLWVLPVGDGALLVTGLTDADLIVIDASEFAAIVASVRFGEEVDAGLGVPADVVAAPAPERRVAPPAPDGWLDETDGEERLLRRLVALGGAEHPAVITVTEALAVDGGALEHHVAVLEDLDATMTDPELQQTGPDPIAVGVMQRSAVVFRQGTGARVADLWTGDPADALPVVLVLSDFADPDGRARAVDWVRAATREELGLG